MQQLLRYETYKLSFHFYRSILLVSAVATIFLLIPDISIFTILVLKALAFGFVYLLFNEVNNKKRMVFYHNFGISKNLLFGVSFVFDVVLTLLLNLLYSFWL
nr:hypothetical protein [Allomuricauda sp.]